MGDDQKVFGVSFWGGATGGEGQVDQVVREPVARGFSFVSC